MRISRLWNAAVAVLGVVALVLQFVLILQGVNALTDAAGAIPPTGTRVVRFFSYFTVQSNILCTVAAVTLAMNPLRDGHGWRVLRIAATVGITVTFVIYLYALRPLLNLDGAAEAADTLLHIVMPITVVLGWLLFGPRLRLELKTLMLMLIWPALYMVYTIIHGAISDWYPYPFTDVNALGYGTVLRNGVFVAILLLAVGGLYLLLDRKLPASERQTDPARR